MRVESYTADQINRMFFDKSIEDGQRFAPKDAVASGLDATSASKDNVPTANGVGGWDWKPVPAGTGGSGGGSYRGDWNAATAYDAGDLVSHNGILWVALTGFNAEPTEMVIEPQGGNGTGTTRLGDRLGGAVASVINMFGVDNDITLGSILISKFTAAAFGSQVSFGILTNRPAVGSTGQPPMSDFVNGDSGLSMIYPADMPAPDADGFIELKFSNPVRLTADTNYYIYLSSPTGLADLTSDDSMNFTSPVKIPAVYYDDTQAVVHYRNNVNDTWQKSPYHIFFKLGVAYSADWKGIADLTGPVTGGGSGGAVSSVNGQTGDVVLGASDVGALDQATADTLYAPAGSTGGGGAVDSVNGETGAVQLSAQDVGAIPAGDITIIDVVTQAEYDALATKVPTTLYVIQG